jgi:uncharacterized protein (DUF2062 family)
VKDFLRRRLVRPVVEQLTQGLSPGAIALTIAIGLAIAVIPIVGTTTVLCTTAAIVLRLNQPLIQAINYLSFPLQLAFILPYLRLGRLLFGGPAIQLSAQELAVFVTSRPMEAAETLWRVTLQALGAWLLTAPLIVAVVFFAMRPVLKVAARRLRSGGGAGSESRTRREPGAEAPLELPAQPAAEPASVLVASGEPAGVDPDGR